MSEVEEKLEDQIEGEAGQEGVNEPPPSGKKGGGEPDCPDCPGGSPPWMATFADMVTLLMAFFVLILSFANVNVPKFEQVSGSLKVAFGVKRVIPKINIPMAETLLRTEFTPTDAETTLIPDKSQQVKDPTKNYVKQMTEENDAPFLKEEELAKVREALEEEIAAAQVKVTTQGENIVVEMISQDQQQPISDNDNGLSNPVPQEVLDVAKKVADLKQTITSPLAFATSAPEQQQGGGESSGADKLEQIRSYVSEEIEKGLAEVELDGDKVVIRLGQQDSFDSGRAEIKPTFENTLRKVGLAVNDVGGIVRIEGHTDNVPVGFNARYRSNWDLSSARSASVADYILATTSLQSGNVSVAGFADSKPIAANNTAEGRARNRRIEVIVDG